MENTKFIEELKEMTVLQLNDLVKAIEEEFGVTAAAPVAAAGGAVSEAESSEKTVKLVDGGAAKIKVIKAVRELTGLGLKEAKELVDGGGNIKENIDPAEAETVKAQLEELGASVELV